MDIYELSRTGLYLFEENINSPALADFFDAENVNKKSELAEILMQALKYKNQVVFSFKKSFLMNRNSIMLGIKLNPDGVMCCKDFMKWYEKFYLNRETFLKKAENYYSSFHYNSEMALSYSSYKIPEENFTSELGKIHFLLKSNDCAIVIFSPAENGFVEVSCGIFSTDFYHLKDCEIKLREKASDLHQYFLQNEEIYPVYDQLFYFNKVDIKEFNPAEKENNQQKE